MHKLNVQKHIYGKICLCIYTHTHTACTYTRFHSSVQERERERERETEREACIYTWVHIEADINTYIILEAYMHTYIHIYIHTYIHTHIHTHTHTSIEAWYVSCWKAFSVFWVSDRDSSSSSWNRMHECMYTYTHACMHVCMIRPFRLSVSSSCDNCLNVDVCRHMHERCLFGSAGSPWRPCVWTCMYACTYEHACMLVRVCWKMLRMYVRMYVDLQSLN